LAPYIFPQKAYISIKYPPILAYVLRSTFSFSISF